MAREITMLLSKNSQIVQEYLDQFGLKLQVRELEQSTRTAQDAADAVGCQIGQIVKSLIFKSAERPLLFLVSGKNQLDVAKVSSQLCITLEKADADFVRENTGFPIGGVPPVAHAHQMEVYIDRDLMVYDLIWAAAGTPHAVFPLKSEDLPRITGGRLIDVQ
jgi:prolyl-tRNA editing enzyme YbaK/EbsC (Cys-tRNA(Pro) deacylase)